MKKSRVIVLHLVLLVFGFSPSPTVGRTGFRSENMYKRDETKAIGMFVLRSSGVGVGKM